MSANTSTHRLAVRVEEAAEMLGVSSSTLYRMIRAGMIPHSRIGRRIVIPVKALEEWLDADARTRTWASYDAPGGAR